MDDYLIHWGIPGQRKGERRFQYKDGSLTPEGRIRYGVGPSRESDGAKEAKATSSGSNTSNENSSQKSQKSAVSVEFKKPESSSTASNSPTEPHKETAEEHRAKVQRAIKSGNKDEVKKYALDMTSDELRKAMDKVDLMQKLNASMLRILLIEYPIITQQLPTHGITLQELIILSTKMGMILS